MRTSKRVGRGTTIVQGNIGFGVMKKRNSSGNSVPTVFWGTLRCFIIRLLQSKSARVKMVRNRKKEICRIPYSTQFGTVFTCCVPHCSPRMGHKVPFIVRHKNYRSFSRNFIQNCWESFGQYVNSYQTVGFH